MKLIRAAAASALMLAAAATASPAAADGAVMGTYAFEAEGSESAQWNLTPCAVDTPNCVHVAASGSDQRAPWSGDAYLSVGSWIMVVGQPDAALCENGTKVPGLKTYSWDSYSLSGYGSINGIDCGGEKPTNIAVPFTLTQTGAPPVTPTAPLDVEPAQAPAGPLPAESPATAVATPG